VVGREGEKGKKGWMMENGEGRGGEDERKGRERALLRIGGRSGLRHRTRRRYGPMKRRAIATKVKAKVR
jgi:hypothetical protein